MEEVKNRLGKVVVAVLPYVVAVARVGGGGGDALVVVAAGHVCIVVHRRPHSGAE